MASMNRQGPNKIDYCDYTWNPIAGKCLHHCPYCYMRGIWKRFPETAKKKINPQTSWPREPSKIFVGSSTDMWGDWIPAEWIQQVLDMCAAHPEHTFQFLTKNPKRYGDFYCIENGWYGTTVDGTERTRHNIADLVYCTQAGMAGRFVSFEPLLAPVEPDLFGIQWVIIGADSIRGAIKPPKIWADIIIDKARENNIPVFVKNNYGYLERIKETTI